MKTNDIPWRLEGQMGGGGAFNKSMADFHSNFTVCIISIVNTYREKACERSKGI